MVETGETGKKLYNEYNAEKNSAKQKQNREMSLKNSIFLFLR